MDRIISKEEEREDPRRDSSIYLRVQWCFHNSTRTTRNPTFLQVFQPSRAILHTELILLQEFSKKYYNYKAHPMSSRADQYKASSSDCSRVSKHSTRQNPAIMPYSTSRLPAILPGRNSILSSRQHPRNPYSSSQAHSYKNSTRRNRILSKRVKYCISNTILRSVCSNLLVTRILILSRVLVTPCEDTVHYLQSKLS